MLQKVEDIHTKENVQTTVLQNLEVRCRKFTDQLTDISNEFDLVKQLVHKQPPPQPALVGKPAVLRHFRASPV